MTNLSLLLVVFIFIKHGDLNTSDRLNNNQTTLQILTTPITRFGEESSSKAPLTCTYAPGFSVGDRKHELECCAAVEERYEFAWSIFSRPLNRHLETLRNWNCPQFEEECERRLFATTPFTSLLYDYFCNYTKFVDQCYETVNKTVYFDQPFITDGVFSGSTSNNTSIRLDQWRNLLSFINTSQLTIEELLQPCLQVAQYDMEEIHRGDFQELNSIEVPSCEQVWCGFSGKVMSERDISLWTCMSSSCHAKIITIMVVCGIMAVITTTFNILVIIVMTTEPKFKHSQSIYKIALAGADLLVGIVVLPTCINNLATLVWSRHVQAGLVDVQVYEKLNGNLSENVTTARLRLLSGRFSAQFPLSYRNSIGFFTSITIFYSLYTLAGASIDRFLAVARPLVYRRHEVKRIAKWICGVALILAALFSTFPFFINTLSYSLILSILISIAGQNGVYLYLATFFIPFVLVWIASILLFKVSKKRSKFRKVHTTETQKKSQERESRLARTLSIMIGVFTINTLPMIILLTCAIFVPSVIPQRPRRFNLTTFYYLITFQYVATMLLVGNSFWNFLIYSFRNADFRSSVKRLFGNVLEKIGIDSSWSSSAQKFNARSNYDKTCASTHHMASKYRAKRRKKRFSITLTRFTTRGASLNLEILETARKPSATSRSTSDPSTDSKPFQTPLTKSEVNVPRQRLSEVASDDIFHNIPTVKRSSTFEASSVEDCRPTDGFVASVVQDADEIITQDENTSIKYS